MPVEIHGKDYKTVAERIKEFRAEHPEKTIETQMIDRSGTQDGDMVCVKALILDGDRLLSTGYAEERRGSSNINKADPLENCETGAVGRALGFFGYLGTDVASVEEVADAKLQQLEKDMWAAWAAHTEKVEEHHATLLAVREFLEEDNFDAAREVWNEVSNDDKMILWRATTKGGWFTPRERQQMKYWSNDFENSRKG